MKTQIWLFFFLLSNAGLAIAQISDDFSSGSGLDVSIWEGDIDDFVLEHGRLRLSADEAGLSRIWAALEYTEMTEIQLDFEMDFSPSTANQLEVYLWSSAPDDSGSALIIRIGESGSDDNVELYWRQDGDDMLLAEGREGAMGSDPAISSVIIRIDGQSVVCHGLYPAGIVDVIEAQLPMSLASQGYFGLGCRYTSTRVDRFYFDELYVGPLRMEDASPRVVSADLSGGTVDVRYSEPMDASTGDLLSYSLDDRSPEAIVVSDFAQRASLDFGDQMFVPGESYTLDISVGDLAASPLDTSIILRVPEPLKPGDLLINEILFNPVDDGSDYVEIINVSDKIISTAQLSINNSDNGDTHAISAPVEIMPGQIIAWTDDRADIISRYPDGDADYIFESRIPRWSNGNGNVTISWAGTVIDSYDYDEDDHHPLLSDVDGVSLERISTAADADWTSSGAPSGGTPGAANAAMSTTAESPTVSLIPKTFSPDGDGRDDELMIDYVMPSIDYVATISVYDDRGRYITTLLDNTPLSGSGQLIWDGRDQDGSLVPIGIYIIVIDAYSLDGDRYADRLPFVLAGQIGG